MTTEPAAWVIGAGGLVGGAVAAAVPGAHASRSLPWGDPAALTDAFCDEARSFALPAAEAGGWLVYWAAGVGFVGTAGDVLDQEAASLSAFLKAITAQRPPGPGCLVLISSAGAVYAGCRSGPFTESTPPMAMSGYGESKLLQEELAAAAGNALGVPVLVTRIANVYGQRQDVRKQQGLISHLCRSAVTGQPLNLYVPLDTMRHYVFATDVGIALYAAGLRAWQQQGTTPTVKIISGGPSTTVGQVVNVVRRVARHPLRVSYGADPSGALQPPDLRLRSEVWTDLDGEVGRTDLVAGVKHVYDAMFRDIVGVR